MKTKTLLLLFALLFLGARPQTPQSGIQRTQLKDGVERWHRVKAPGEKPWFFQQVENLFNVAFSPKEQLPFGASVALLVGVSEYAYLSPQLPFVKNDLRDMREFLLNEGGFDTVYVVSEKIVNRDLVDGYVRNKIGRNLKSRDRFMFYYSGHGADNRGKTGYMQFAQAVPGDFVGTQVLPIRTALDWSSELNIDHQLFVFDCCASGLAFTSKGGPGDLLASLSGNGCRMIMTAGTAEEKTYEVEGREGKGNGVFTRAFLNAARSGSADKGTARDGFITIEEILAQVKTEVARFKDTYKKSVTPRLWPLEEADYRGTFVFVNPQAQSQGLALQDDYAQKLNARAKGEVVDVYGSVYVIALLSGEVYIDDKSEDTIENGEAKIYPALVGTRRIAIRGASETVTQTVNVTKGQTARVTLQPKRIAPPPVVTPTEPTTSAPAGMVLIPAGTFMMGSNDYDDEKPPHQVSVEAFYMDKYEVTVAQYQKFLAANPSQTKPDNWNEQLQNSNRPVVYVSWHDAVAYCEWLSKQRGKRVRLPTEAEWEYAARGGLSGKKYPWGDEISSSQANYGNRWDSEWSKGPGKYLREVGSYAKNGYGLYDMAGNVWEWCSSLYKSYPYNRADGRENMSASDARVLRGGSWFSIPTNCRCAYRVRPAPTFRDVNVGFRCAQDVLF